MTDEQIKAALDSLEGWALADGRPAITRKFKFKDFRTAWTFMEDCAVEADEMSHHPEWTNIYNRVEVVLTTHDSGGVTDLDIALAQFMNEAADAVEKEQF
jgi:4a-hydroxytetrahydrobiopterin dehydratase